ncbi:isochorismatase family protein [Streptomyces sp. NBC_00080]|uniref:isochorismatase family protein n=1 Tax=unclassified Streptomyces TaxID=2593676 RepID=UPI00114E07CB|nr:isochorismatase family protein [Streptomyces sp. SLBN-115]TQJ37113.1 isochorismate hydrolase [Streptomyces sp. SLBN-115]
MTGIPAISAYPLPTTGQLPAGPAPWEFDPGRAVLLVHDMQRYFLAALPAPLRQELLDNAVRLREHCALLDVPIAYTAQSGDMGARDRGLLKDFWGPGMRASAEDRAIATALEPDTDQPVFAKWRYSAFYRSRLSAWMRDRRRDQLVLCGVYAHIGVLATAVDAFSRDIETFLVADAVADFSERQHRLALEYAAALCARVVTTKELVG